MLPLKKGEAEESKEKKEKKGERKKEKRKRKSGADGVVGGRTVVGETGVEFGIDEERESMAGRANEREREREYVLLFRASARWISAKFERALTREKCQSE